MSDAETPTVLAGALEETGLPASAAAAAEEPDGAIHPPVEVALAGSGYGPGTLVEYCLPEGHGIGEWRPALLIKEWQPGYWSLCVFTDGGNDGLDCPRWVPAVLEGTAPGFFRPVPGARPASGYPAAAGLKGGA